MKFSELFDLVPFQRYGKVWYKCTPRWDDIEKIDIFSQLKGCMQSPKWHSEGDAWVHTKMVTERAAEYTEFTASFDSEHPVTPFRTMVIMLAALLHDVGKPATTFEKNGVWHSYGHEKKSEMIARKFLWDWDFELREDVCALIRHHMDVVFVFEDADYARKIIDICADVPSMEWLCILKRCDCEGSICQVPEENARSLKIIDEVEHISEYFSAPRYCVQLFSNNARYEYLYHDGCRQRLFDERAVDIYVLIGLPGSGKNYYVENKLLQRAPGAVVLSRDDIRAELGVCDAGKKCVGTKEEEEQVSKIFDERLRNAVKEHKTVIINNINLKKKYRNGYKTTINGLGYVRWIYVYVETDFENVIARRKEDIPENILHEMISTFEFPVRQEYNSIEIVIYKKDRCDD